MTIKEKFSSIDQSKLTADQKSFLSKIKNVTKDFSIKDKDVNDKVEGALDKMIATLKEKMPEAIKSKSTTAPKTPRKRSVMSVAKEIKKPEESFEEAKKRATKKIADDKQSVKETIKSELDKLNEFIKKKKTLQSIKGTDLLIDSKRKAKPVGRRLSKTGNVYYEYRDSKTDRLSPNYPKNAPYLELGGSVVTDLAGHTGGGNAGLNAGMPLDGFSNTAYSGLVGETGAMSSGEMFMAGGSVRNIKWANADNKKLGVWLLTSVDGNAILNKSKNASELEKNVMDFYKKRGSVARMTWDDDADEGLSWVTFTDLYNEIKSNYMSGGSVGMANQQVIDDASQGYVNYYLGEGASQGIYAKGGAIMNQYSGKTPENVWDILSTTQRYHFLHDHKKEIESTPASVDKATKTAYKFLPEKIKMSFKNHIQMGQYARGGGVRKVGNREYSYGRNWTNDHRHVNKSENHEVTYNRKGKFLGIFAGGGSLSNEFKEVEDFGNEQFFIRDFGHVIIGDDKKIELVAVARLIDLDDFMSEDEIPAEGKYQLDFDLVPKEKYLSKSRKNEVNDEDNSISSVTEINVVNYMGGLRFEPSDKNFFKTYESAKNHLMSKELNEKITGMGVMSGFIMDMPYNRMGKTNWEQLDYILGITDKFNKGGSVINERKHVNKDEDYEVRYSKPRPSRKGYLGKRDFMAGGLVETPKIYVADLEAYNNGKLVGEWLDLTDYNDADELMDAIQDVLKKSGGEEYAIHDYENLPRSMYSEYMGYKDFVEIYEMMDLAKEKDLPLDVAFEIVSQFDRSALDEFTGVYDSEQDFAEQLVDETGITSFNNFQYYLEISETDRRLLAQEEADSYVDDIRNEDGGNRLIEEADLDVEEYEEADSERQEEMLDEAREIVYDRLYDRTYEGLDDPYSYYVDELGIYDAETFVNFFFVRIDYEKLADALEDDYTFVRHDGQIYVFNIR
jgi:antirestriction protein